MPEIRTFPCKHCGKEIQSSNPRKMFCNKQCSDNSRNLPLPRPGDGGEVVLRHFSKFPQEIRNQILLGETDEKIGIYDIEATHLEANVGRILCAVVKTVGVPGHKIFTAHERKYKRPDNFDDSALAADIRDYLETFDIIVGHNSKMFDTKFINARNLKAGQRTKKPQYQVDTFWSWKSKARAWGSLSAIQQFLATPTEKTSISWGSWMNALGWDKDLRVKAMDEIVEHCILDVNALEEVYVALVKADVIRSLRHDGGVL